MFVLNRPHLKVICISHVRPQKGCISVAMETVCEWDGVREANVVKYLWKSHTVHMRVPYCKVSGVPIAYLLCVCVHLYSFLSSCALCSKIFCQACAAKTCKLAASKKPVRVCDDCYDELNR